MYPLRRAVFLDRDGVLNYPIIKNGKSFPPASLDHFVLMPHALEALQSLKNNNFYLFVITNQPDVGRGMQPQEIVEQMHQYLLQHLPLDAIEVCYDENDSAYKPSPSMLLKLADSYDIELSQSYMVGDRWRDIDAGKAAGCRTIFIDHHYQESLKQAPDYSCTNLYEAAQFILEKERLC